MQKIITGFFLVLAIIVLVTFLSGKHAIDSALTTQKQVEVVNSASSVDGQSDDAKRVEVVTPDARPVQSFRRVSGALPPRNSRLTEIFEVLRDRAKRGDSAAACRLAIDLMTCSTSRWAVKAAEQIAASGASGGPGGLDQSNAMLKGLQADMAMCKGVSSEMLSQAFDFQKVAAKNQPEVYSGWLAANPALDKQNFLSQLDSWRDYKSFAENYYSGLLASKKINDLPVLLAVFSPENVGGARPPYHGGNSAIFLALYKVAKSNGVVVTRDIEAAAVELIEDNQTPIDASVLDGWTGVIGGESEKKIAEIMYPGARSASFCK